MRTDESDDRDSGVGAVANPYAITVFADTGLTVNFTLAIAIVDGQTQIIPGVQVLPAATTPLTTYPDIQAQLQGAIQIATITLGVGTLSAEPFPSFGVLLRVGNSQPNGLLMSAEALSVGAAQVGVTYTVGAASPFSPSFALLNVTSGNNNWASIDPSNFSANVASVATTALQTALTKYMAQSATLSALATATGLIVPTGAPSDYQTIPQNYLDAALAAPLTALGSFYT